MIQDRYLRLYAYVLAVAFAYGAAVHVTNIAGFSGGPWLDWPLKWQVLDVVFLVVNLVAAWGLLKARRWGLGLAASAMAVQIVLYTWGRDWVTDVPAGFAVSDEMLGSLDTLVIVHHVALLGLIMLIWWGSRKPKGG